MVRIFPGDLVGVEAGGRHHYAVILDRTVMFGGNWCFALHRTSEVPLAPDEILSGPGEGFHAFVDFIHAKREGRITRLAKKVDTRPFAGCGRLKLTMTLTGRADRWWLFDMENRELGVVGELSDEQRRYPLKETIDDVLMVERIARRWRPELDPRI